MIEEIQDKKTRGGQAGAAHWIALNRESAPSTQLPQQGTDNQSPARIAISDKVSISPEARQPENLSGAPRVNFESWGLSLGSQTQNQVHKQQGVSTVTPVQEPSKSPEIVKGADLENPIAAAGSSPQLDKIGIGEAAQAQVVKKSDEARRTTPFVIDHEAPVVTTG